MDSYIHPPQNPLDLSAGMTQQIRDRDGISNLPLLRPYLFVTLCSWLIPLVRNAVEFKSHLIAYFLSYYYAQDHIQASAIYGHPWESRMFLTIPHAS
jgi:hypothetical protein